TSRTTTLETATQRPSDPGSDGVQDLPNSGDTTIYPGGDVDWYSWQNSCRQHWYIFSGDNGPNAAKFDVYVNGVLVATDQVGYSPGAGCRNIEFEVHAGMPNASYFYGSASYLEAISTPGYTVGGCKRRANERSITGRYEPTSRLAGAGLKCPLSRLSGCLLAPAVTTLE